MKRKLIKQGLGGMTIYLPKKWIERKGLKGGDEINLIETEAGLIIGSESKEKKKVKITITDKNRHDILHILTHAYRKGYETITMEGLSDKDLRIIKNIVKDWLIGFEITEKTNSSCKIENISGSMVNVTNLYANSGSISTLNLTNVSATNINTTNITGSGVVSGSSVYGEIKSG